MITLINSKDKTKMILIALDESDKKTLEVLYDTHICWGFYQLTLIDKSKAEAQKVKQLLERYPNATAIGYFSSPEGFVNKYEKRKIQ